jgi:phage protein U
MNLPNISLPNIPGIPGLPKLPDLPGMPSLSLGGLDGLSGLAGATGAPPLADTMMCLGDFVFELASVPYQTINEDWAWRHPESPRVGAPPASQFAGKETDKLKLSGELYPGLTGGMVTLADLRGMAEAGDAYTLIDGLYNNLGEFVIEKISVTRTDFLPNGVARRVEFNLELKRVEEVAEEDAAAAAEADALDVADAVGDALDAAKSAVDSLASAVSDGLSSLLPGSLPDLAGSAPGALSDLTAAVSENLPSINVVAACAAGSAAALDVSAFSVSAAINSAVAATTGFPASTIGAVISSSSTGEALTAAANESAEAATRMLPW